MTDAPYRVAHVSEIVTPQREQPGVAPWRAVRRHFDIESFGIAARDRRQDAGRSKRDRGYTPVGGVPITFRERVEGTGRGIGCRCPTDGVPGRLVGERGTTCTTDGIHHLQEPLPPEPWHHVRASPGLGTSWPILNGQGVLATTPMPA